MKKLICLLLSLLTLSACAGNTNADNGTNTGTSAAVTETEKTEYILETRDFDGYDFTVLWPETLSSGHFNYNEIDSEAINGEIINDAVYERNLAVEEDYNISINSEKDSFDNIPKLIEKAVSAGDDSYDGFCTQIAQISPLGLNGFLVDFNNMEYYSKEQPFWNHGLMDSLSIGGKKYFATGDIIFSDEFYPYLVLYSMSLAEDHNIGDLYGIVNSGEWTMDTMLSMASTVGTDLDGNGSYTYDDRYGILLVDSGIKGFYFGSGQHITGKDENGSVILDMYGEKTISVIEKIKSMYHTDNITFNSQNNRMPGLDHSNTSEKMFSQKQGLFIVTTLISVERLRASEEDFGLLPMPKYDTDQDSYYCVLNDMTLLGVPSTASDTSRTSLILSAMSKESTDTVAMAFREIVLTSKYIRDEESVQMLELILDSTVAPDPGVINDFGGLYSSLVKFVSGNKDDFASTYSSLESKALSAIDKYNETIQ